MARRTGRVKTQYSVKLTESNKEVSSVKLDEIKKEAPEPKHKRMEGPESQSKAGTEGKSVVSGRTKGSNEATQPHEEDLERFPKGPELD